MDFFQLMDEIHSAKPNRDSVSDIGEVLPVHRGPVVQVGVGGQEPARVKLLLHQDVSPDAESCQGECGKKHDCFRRLLHQEGAVAGEDLLAD